jgi:hypothetical protein
MPNISGDIARQDTVIPATLHLRNPENKPFSIFVAFRPNRVSYEGITDEEIESYINNLSDEQMELVGGDERLINWRDAFGFCEMVAEWDATGLRNRQGKQVIGEDDVIPLEPIYIKMVPAWLTLAINRELIDRVGPNGSGSKRSRGR